MASSLGAQASHGKPDSVTEHKALLNTYIHNYLVHEGHFDIAKAIRTSNMSLNQPKLKKENANSRQMNGADDTMDMDSKDDLNNRLDGPNKLGDTFLLEYWFIFWDMWSWSASKRDRQLDNSNDPVGAYWEHQKAKRSQMGNQTMMQQNLMANGFGPFNRPGMMQNQQLNNLQKTAMANNGRSMNPQFQQNLRMQQHMAAQQQMQMEGAEVDFNGQPRPPSPDDNAPSPKRRHVDAAGPFNTGPAMAGRNPMASQLPNGAPGNPEAMRMQNPKNFSPDQLTNMMSNSASNQRNYSRNLANSTKAAMNGNDMPNGMPGGMSQMVPEMPDGSPNGNPELLMYQNAGGKGVGGTNGGALADYQMQLMLLEQQNKKRLMVARQENAHDPQRFGGGNPALGAQAMSPHGSKTGHSPPGSDRQRGTPRMGQGGSPLPDGPQNRSSPAPGAFGDLNAMNMGQPFMHPNGGNPMMRPPGSGPPGTPGSTHPLNAQQFEMFQRNNGRMPSGNWGQPGMPGQMPGPPQQQGNPDNGNNQQQQRGNMPPPQAPPAAGKPSPTQQSAPTPTSGQTNTKNTKKKEAKEPKKKNTKKNANQSTTAATPNNDTNRAPTPTPATPNTPVNPESHIIKGQQPPNTQPPQQQQSNNSTAASTMAGAQDNGGMNNPAPFGNIGSMDSEIFNVDYMDGHHDVLDAFDFDTFLESGAMEGAMDGGPFPDFQLPADGMETGTGDP